MSGDIPKTILSLFFCGHALVIKPIHIQGGNNMTTFLLTIFFLYVAINIILFIWSVWDGWFY